MPQQRSHKPPSPLSKIFNWLRSVLAPPKPAEAPREIVVRAIEFKGKCAALMPVNLVHEIEDSDPWSICTLRITPLRYRDRSTVPIVSAKEFWYLFLSRIPPSKRQQEAVVLRAAGQELKLRRSQASSEFGTYRLTVLHVGDRTDQSTWKPILVESLRLSDDSKGRALMTQLGLKLLTMRCADTAWGKVLEDKLKKFSLGHTRKLWEEELAKDPFSRG